MGNRSIAVVAVAGVLAASPATALAADGSTGGAPAPSSGPRSKQSQHRKHRKVKLPKVMKKIAICESGGDIHAVSPSGKYRGKWQFDMDTWHSVGGKGDPARASQYRQDKLAMKLYRREGTKPWPECSRRVKNGEFDAR